MRIAMVSEHASPLATMGGTDAGGQNVHVAALAGALARAGVEVVVHTRRTDEQSADRVEMVPGVVVEHMPAGPPLPLPKDELLPHMGELAANLHRSWWARPPDVVHGHFWMSGFAALEAARPLHLPVVQTFHALGVVKRRHQGAMDTSPPQRLAIETAVVQEADRIVATCTDEVAELTRLGADPRRVWVVPCGVNLAAFRPGGPSEARPPGRFRLVAVTRLVERKGIADIIAALVDLPGADLVVVGGPPLAELDDDREAQRLRRLAAELGVADRVDLRGGLRRAAVPIIMRSADAVVCVPWYEPFGMVAVEAMACGVPVVASAVGGHLETVLDDVTSCLVPPRDVRRLGQVLSDLLADPVRRARLGAAGAARASGQYGWDNVARATLDVYRGLVQRALSARQRRAVNE